MSILFNFVDNHDRNNYNFQTVQSELNERLKEFSDQIKETGVYLSGPFQTLSQYAIEEVVIGNSYVAFRLQDGRVCRISYAIKSEKACKVEKVLKRPSKGVLDKLVNYGNASSSRSETSYLNTSSSRTSIPHRIARYQMLSSHSSTPRVNFIREMQRQGIYLARTFSTPISASEVPDDLIEQCQTVLQGKSRQLIIRELQRTNLDVNMAVNNLLSRDDEADENGGSSNVPDDWEETDDLLSLLDQADNPLFEAAITENGLSIPEEIFPSIRLRRETLYPSMLGNNELDTYVERRKRRRLDCQLRINNSNNTTAATNTEPISQSFYNPVFDESSPGNQDETKSDNSNSNTNGNGNNRKNSLTFGNQLEFWKEPASPNTSPMPQSTSKRRDMRFIKISGMYSELIGISLDNELHQWKWNDPEPWTSNATNNTTSNIAGSCGSTADLLFNNSSIQKPYYHPRLLNLNLIGEKIIQLTSSSTRATVLTQSKKLASWMDEMIAPIFPPLSKHNSDHQLSTVQNLKLEHSAQHFQEIKDETVSEIHTSSLVSAVKCASGNIYWWGVIPFKYRKNAIEKNREKLLIPADDKSSSDSSSNRRSKQQSTTSTNNSTELLQPGTFVCMRNSPIFHAGAIGFTVIGGVPKIGTLLEDAWKVEDVCRFRVKPVQVLVNERRHSSNMNNMSTMNHPASFDPLMHENMCPHINTSFLYGLLGRSGSSSTGSTSVNKQVTITTSDAPMHDSNQLGNNNTSTKTSSTNIVPPAGSSTNVTWAEMPPPPSPASSTCSDQSGPVKISPGPFKRKKQQSHSNQGDLINEVNTESRPASSTSHHRSYKSPSSSHYIPMYDYEPLAGHKRSLTPDDTTSTNASTNSTSNNAQGHKQHLAVQQQPPEEYEEDWCLKDVIFLEDGRTQPIGVVLKQDNEIVAVKFLKDIERACVAVNCPYSPLSTMFGIGNTPGAVSMATQSDSHASSHGSSASGTSGGTSYPFSWLNECRLLRKEELVIMKQPIIPRVPEIVQKTPKCISLDFINETVNNCSTDNIIGMALENELVHLMLRKISNMSQIHYKVVSLTKKVISSSKLSTLSTGFFNNTSNDQLSGILSTSLESEFCELKPGSLFNAERHKPLFVRDGNGTVYPLAFTDNHSVPPSITTASSSNTTGNIVESISNPTWVDLAPVRCVDFALVTKFATQTPSAQNDHLKTTSAINNKPKMNHFLLGFVIVESQNLMTHILRCEDKKVSNLLETFPIFRMQSDIIEAVDANMYEKMITETLDGHRNILHVAISMCEATSNQEVHWKLSAYLNYRPKWKDIPTKNTGITVKPEDLSLSQNRASTWSSMEIGSGGASSMSYRKWREMHNHESNLLYNFNRSTNYANNLSNNSVRFSMLGSTNTQETNNNASGGWLYPPVRSDQKERRAASYRIVNLILNHAAMDRYLIQLLSQKNSDGLTPFMQAISQRLYHIALFILDCVMDLCETQFISVKDATNLVGLKMLFPSAISSMNIPDNDSVYSYNLPNSSASDKSVVPLEDNPLQILCHNDGCSFVWTGPDHIRQDIFECKTCGLTESLCCCTECARICHAGHDCHLKKTSPTAYCDCWEKCKCRTLILGDNTARLELLKRLLEETDFITVQNRDREHILMFLVKTAERQLREQKQARTTTSTSSRRHNIGSGGGGADSGLSRPKLSSQSAEPQMPEYGFDPGLFTISALEMMLGNWPVVETVFWMGDRSDFLGGAYKSMQQNTNNGINLFTDDDVYLNYQSSSEQLDLFVFTLITKTRVDNVDILLATINKQFQLMEESHLNNNSVNTVAKRLVRSVARIYLTLQLQMSSDYSSRKRGGSSGGASSNTGTPVHHHSATSASSSRLSAYHMLSNSNPTTSVAAVVAASTSRPLEVCRRIFESLLIISLTELPRIAVDLLAPIQTGLLKPTGHYSHCSNMSDAIKNMDNIFQISNNMSEKVSDTSRLPAEGGRMRSNIANDHNYQSSGIYQNRGASNISTITIHNESTSVSTTINVANNSSFNRRHTLSIPTDVPTTSAASSASISQHIDSHISMPHANSDSNNSRMSNTRTTSNTRRNNSRVSRTVTATTLNNITTNDDDDEDDEDYEGDDDDMNGGGGAALSNSSETILPRRRSLTRGDYRNIRRMAMNFQPNLTEESSQEVPFDEENDDEVVEEDEENDEEDDDVVTHENSNTSTNENSSRHLTSSNNNDNEITISNENNGNLDVTTARSSIIRQRLKRRSRRSNLSSEESDADGITVDNELEQENEMDAYDEDHDDTDIVPESEESESDTSITSSICVTLEHMDTDSADPRAGRGGEFGSSANGRRSRRRRRQMDAEPDFRIRRAQRINAPLVQPELDEPQSEMASQSNVDNKPPDDDSNIDENMDDGNNPLESNNTNNSSTSHVRMTRLNEMRILPTTINSSTSNTATMATNHSNRSIASRSQRNIDQDASLISEEGDSEEIDEDDEDDDDEDIDTGVSGVVTGGGGGDSSQNTEDEEQQSGNNLGNGAGLLMPQSGPVSHTTSSGNNTTNSTMTTNNSTNTSVGSNSSSGVYRVSGQGGVSNVQSTSTATGTDSSAQFNLQTTQIQLSHSFSHLLKLISHLLSQLQQQQASTCRSHHSDMVSELTKTLAPVWLWICRSMDYLESQVGFSLAFQRRKRQFSHLTNTSSDDHSSQASSSFKKRAILRFDTLNPNTGLHDNTFQGLQSQPGQNQTNINQSDNASRMDFLKYLVSTMRASSDEHSDSIPISLYAVDYCHLAHLVDGLLFLMRFCFMNNPSKARYFGQDRMKKEPTLEGEDLDMYNMDTEDSVSPIAPPEAENTQHDPFFFRTDHPLGWLGIGASSFMTPVADSLPLAHMPQLLQPPGPSDEVFGVLRRFDSHTSNLSELGNRKVEVQEQDPTNYNSRRSMANTMAGRDFEGSIPLHMGVFSKWADNRSMFSNIPVADLRTRWRYSLEILANSFDSTVANEPGSVLAEFTHFSIKETKFRKEMERLRNQCRRDLSLVVSRDRDSVLRGTLNQLCQIYNSRTSNVNSANNAGSSHQGGYYSEPGSIFPNSVNTSNSLPPLLCHRFKVKFSGEPGEGNGVTRSFLTVFAEYAVSDEPLTTSILSSICSSMISQSPISATTTTVSNSTTTSTSNTQHGRKLPRMFSLNRASVTTTSASNEHNYIRMPVRNSTTQSSRILSSSSVASSSNSMMRYVQSLASRVSNSTISRSDNSFMSAFAIFASSGSTTNTTSTNSSAPYYSITPIITTTATTTNSTVSTNTTNTSISLPTRNFVSRLNSATTTPPPDYHKIMRIGDSSTTSSATIPPAPPPPSSSSVLTPPITTNLDAASLAANFINSIGSTSSPVWIGSNWLTSSPTLPRRTLRPLNPHNRSPPSMTILTLLRNWFGSLTEVLLKEISASISMNLLGGSNDVDVLVEEIASDNVRSAEVINIILTHYSTWNVNNTSATMSANTAGGSTSILDATESSEPQPTTSSGSILHNSYAPEINMEVSLLTFNLHLESLVKSYVQEHPRTAATVNKLPHPDTMPEERPDLAPLFWQPGHTDFYSPRRISVPTLLGNTVSPDDSQVNSVRNSLYRCVGRVIGLSLLMNETMPRLKLSRHILKYILGWPLAWHDFAFFNCQLYESLRQLMHTALSHLNSNNREPDPLLDYHLNFSFTPRPEEGGTQDTVLPLVSNGDDQTVTSSNVFMYVKKYCMMRMISLVKIQLEQLKLGVYDVLPHSALAGLSPEDLRLLLNGTDEINVDVLLGYTTFLDESQGGAPSFSAGGGGMVNTGVPFGPGDQASQERVLRFKRWFNSVVRNFNSVQRQNLLYFWTSSPALPASNQGFQPMPSITIRPADDAHLPTANTCISRLYIPLYSSKLILRDKLLQAIETKCFGFV